MSTLSELGVQPADRTAFAGKGLDEKASVTPERHKTVIPLLLLIGLIVLATIVRIVATHNDLWLDELISLRTASALKTPWQIFTAVHNDNNHYLNTLYLYILGKGHDPATYRYFSVVLGIALVPAGFWLLVRRSRAEAVILATLLACSYPLIHFSSEARGYAGAVLWLVLASGALTRWVMPGSSNRKSFFLGLAYGIASVLAVLSHLTAYLIWIALALGSLITVADRPGRKKWIANWIAFNSLPAGALAALYFLDLRYLHELGGSPMTVPHALGRLLALGLGWPAKDAASVCILLVPLMALIGWRLAVERKSGEPLAILLMLIYATMLACLFVVHSSFFSSRYFLIFLPFVYVGIAMLLGQLLSRKGGRVALATILALFVAGQARLYAKFLQIGRGQFTSALAYITSHTSSSRIAVASDQDFRSSIELGYFAPRALRHQQLFYLPQSSKASFQPDWYIEHAEGYEEPGPATLNLPGQPTWYRVAYFGASELSGQTWTIYSHQASH